MRRALAFTFLLALLLSSAGAAQSPTENTTASLSVPRRAIELSETSTVHILERSKGPNQSWSGDCTATKISATELISAKHCFDQAVTGVLPSNAFPASNYIATTPLDYAVADPEDINLPILEITGISLARLSDLALLTVSPNRAPATVDDRRVWQRVTVLPYPPADNPPVPGTQAVITSYPEDKHLRFHKVTYFGSFVSRAGASPGPLEDTITLPDRPAGACRPGASGSRLIFANGTASGALSSYWKDRCTFSVLTDRTLRGLRVGLHHFAIAQPWPPPPQLEPLPDPTLTAASFDGLSFRLHFVGNAYRLRQDYVDCPAGSWTFGGGGGTFALDQISESAGGWTVVDYSANGYGGEGYLENGNLVGIDFLLELHSNTDGFGNISGGIGCPSKPPRAIPTSGGFDNSWVGGTVSGDFQVCPSYSYARPHPYDMYVTVTVHVCPTPVATPASAAASR